MLKSATVAVVGRPSSGKSTLVNALCGGKVSIVSPVPQTTRNRVRGILTAPAGQLVFIDTPGFHLSEKKLNQYMGSLVNAALAEVDVVLYLLDGTREPGTEERALIDAIRTAAKPAVACVSKKDLESESRELVRRVAAQELPGARLLEASALTGEGLDGLREALFQLSPEGEQLYPPDYYTDQTPEFRISEIVREKAMLQTREEVPHALYVRIEDLEMRQEGAFLQARGFICVERESQKGIVVGRGGEKIHTIVSEAERELAEIFPYPVRLDIRVKVDREWRKRDPLLRRLIQ
ncbi:MAG TPA: GTPase Era [Spirochaetia bacterium]|nr:GTPase Era [Spirochaetia bacterium]